ncbi:MAG: histidinol-phosphate transaminase [Peptococcales bacterium]|jgi:histidinol-phosphate aminotransferase
MKDNTLLRHCASELTPFTPELEDLPVEEMKRVLNLSKVAKLSFNEAPLGPSPLAIKAMQEAALNPNLYPDAESKILRDKLSSYYNLPIDNFAVSNGADEMIVLLSQAFLNEGEEVIIPFPTFGQYFASSKLMGAKPIKVELTNFTIDLNKIKNEITDKSKMIILCNPNNPTGTIIGKELLLDFLKDLPKEIILVVDEAYAEYVASPDYESVLPLVSSYPNVIGIRTFSKIYGLAACRVGYAVADPGLIRAINKVRPPFNMNVFAQVGAVKALHDQEYVQAIYNYNLEAKNKLYNFLEELKLPYIPSHTNFVFFDAQRDGREVFNFLAQKGVLVRTAHGWGYPNYIRLTIGSTEDMEMFYEGLKEFYY